MASIPPSDTAARNALERLRDGNARFVSTGRGSDVSLSPARRAELAVGQHPFAVILGCADSRVPPEAVFAQAPGELFVVRVAGNVAGPSQIGSAEFAAEHFGTRLVVVLGHTRCGAVRATVDALREPDARLSGNLRAITDRVRPAVEGLLDAGLTDDALVARAVRANIRASAHELQRGSPLLERLIREDGLAVVGAEYSLNTGLVDFFDGLPASIP